MNSRQLLLPLVTLAGLGSLAPAALAGDIPCPPNPGATTVDGNLVIRSTCTLAGTTIKGNVLLYSGGSLIARDARIIGNIQAERAVFIDVAGSAINGSIQLDQLAGGDTVIVGNRIGGSIQLKTNDSPIEVLGNLVGADVQAFDNGGGVLIADNGIDGNLQCKSNSPAPVGGNNVVGGNREDQCANLLAGSLPGGGTGSGGSIDGDVYCPPGLGKVTVDGNVIATGECVLTGTAVKGNVLVYPGGSLVARDVRIEGNIQAANAESVDVQSSRVIGNIQLDELVRAASRVVGNQVGGNLQFKDNQPYLTVQGNGVGGDVQAFGNRGGIDIADNGISGNLQCKSNVPAPTGGNNRVGGNREDQCANLQAAALAGSPQAPVLAAGAAGVASAEGGGGSTGPLWLAGLLALLAGRSRRARQMPG